MNPTNLPASASAASDSDYAEIRELLAEADEGLVQRIFRADIAAVLNRFDALAEETPNDNEEFRLKLIELFDAQDAAYGAEIAETDDGLVAMQNERRSALEEADPELRETVTLAGQDADRVTAAYVREVEDLKRGTDEAEQLDEIYKTLGKPAGTIVPATQEKNENGTASGTQSSMAA